ncbi:MAG TPA: MotA/TolQ/ExbB proton channel family protein [Candidatus Ozemobacteraceae bacterium]|nr:MotA/TolQ/ExbB proton channel family protein [Candidatus Ozemobacteraceae bacterium]
MFSNLFIVDVFVKGGPVMVPIMLCSVIGVAIMIERARFYLRRANGAEQFMVHVRSALAARDYLEAIRMCRKETHPLARVIEAGIDRLDLPKDALLDVMRQEALRQMKRYEHNTGILSTIAAISPLLGLTGTVTGMISSFSIISTIGIGDPTALAGGISEALYTTAAGLFIGIPALAAFNWCESRIKEFEEQVEYYSLDLANNLALSASTPEGHREKAAA